MKRRSGLVRKRRWRLAAPMYEVRFGKFGERSSRNCKANAEGCPGAARGRGSKGAEAADVALQPLVCLFEHIPNQSGEID